MSKEFKTVEELVSILESRGVITDDNTKSIIERESYYAIVNGYKKPFLDSKAMEFNSDDVFQKGTRFEWIYDLFQFDRELRIITFKYLIRAESIMRTAVSYAFCNSHREKDAYLKKSSFCNSSNYLLPRKFRGNAQELFEKNLDRLLRILNKKIAINRNSRSFIKHYVNTHGEVPLWVLANDLTFGNFVHFFQLMQPNDRRQACTIIARITKRDQKARGFLSERILLRSATILKDFRNYCAHDERLYCAKSGNADFSIMLAKLYDLLPKEEIYQFQDEIADLYGSYKERLHNIDFRYLLNEMGFKEEH